MTDTLAVTPQRVTVFWALVERRGVDDCWPWHGYLDEDGYGQFHVDDAVERGRHHVPAAQLLTDDQVRVIRRRREAGAAQVDLADQYGISQSFVSQLVTGRKRPNAGGPIQPPNSQYRRKEPA